MVFYKQIMDTFQYIIDKYKITVGKQHIIDIPDMGRIELAGLFAELGFNLGAEIGVEKGRYSEVLCMANPNLHLHSIDPWINTAYEQGIPDGQASFSTAFEITKRRLAPYPNCHIVRKTSSDALDDFEDNSLDFVYIDANHDFPNFTFDLHNWLKKIKEGGIMSGHDYQVMSYKRFNHVKRALDAYTRSYRMIPFFVVGDFEVKPGLIRDKWRSWFWVKKEGGLR